MSKNTSLYIKMCEAKNLPIKDVSGSSDPYCVIKIDNQVIARTSTVWRSLNPFWGEEYSLHLPNGFHQMSLYVYDEDKLNRDDFIGTVTLLKERLRSTSKGISGWFQLRESNKDEEIQGEVHLEIYKMTSDDKIYIKIKVIEARELAPKDTSGTSDPFVRVSFLQITKQTQKIKASRFPKWHECMEFEVPSFIEKSQELRISVWDWDRIGGDNFMGQVVLLLGDIKEGKVFNQWFRLLPSEDLCKSKDSKPRGSIRIQARLQEERILPSEYYKELIQLLNDSVSSDKHDLSGPTPLKMLQEVTMLDLHEMSSTLVKLYLGQGNIVQFLDMICAEEIQDTGSPNTLFRGNSLATKSVDQFMKIVGIPYLLETLGPIIKIIYEENKLVELDPFKLQLMRKHSLRRPSIKLSVSNDDFIDTSRDIVLRYLNLIHENLINTVTKIPPVMRLVFKNLQKHILNKWPDNQYKDHKYLGVSGFLFLRFLVPAILGPKLFFLKDQHPSARISRTLTLIAKAIQCVGNLQSGVGKEQYLEPLHPFIKASVKGIRGYIDKLCDIDAAKVHIDMTRRRSVFHPSVVVKQGYLYKKRWYENKQFKSMVFKKRYFWLKYDCISYASKPTDQVRTTMTMHQIIAVEFVDKSAFRKGNVGQIITRNSRGGVEIVYFHAKDVNEAYSWVSSLRKMVLVNCDTLDYFHPGAFRHNKWTCCLQTSKQNDGCSKTHTHAVLGDWRDPLDPDVEAQTIYSQLYHGRHKLRQKYLHSNEEIRKSMLSLHTLGNLGGDGASPGETPRRASHSDVHKHSSSYSLEYAQQNRRHSNTSCSNRKGSRPSLNADIRRVRMERRGSYSNPEINLQRRCSNTVRRLLPQPRVDIQINVHCVDDDTNTTENTSSTRRNSQTIDNCIRKKGSSEFHGGDIKPIGNCDIGRSVMDTHGQRHRTSSHGNIGINTGFVVPKVKEERRSSHHNLYHNLHRSSLADDNSRDVNMCNGRATGNGTCTYGNRRNSSDSRRGSESTHRSRSADMRRLSNHQRGSMDQSTDYNCKQSYESYNHGSQDYHKTNQNHKGTRKHSQEGKIKLDKSFIAHNHGLHSRHEAEMITLFKAKSQNDFANTTIPGIRGMITRDDDMYRRRSASDCYQIGKLKVRPSPSMQQRHSIGSSDVRYYTTADGSMLSLPFSKPPSEIEAELSSLAQLLDVVGDLERVHSAYDKMEMERKRDTLHNVLDNSFTDLCDNNDEKKDDAIIKQL